jgi:hypothetical protein
MEEIRARAGMDKKTVGQSYALRSLEVGRGIGCVVSGLDSDDNLPARSHNQHLIHFPCKSDITTQLQGIVSAIEARVQL